jgi:hypothetical protein
MKRLMLFAPAVVLAAACSSQSGSIQPGQWEMKTRATSFEVPGMPPALAKQMQDQMAAREETHTTCITPAQAANPAGNMFSQNTQGCNFTDQTFSGGVIRVRGTCQVAGQGQVQMAWEGRYTATTMEGNVTTEVTEGPQRMRMTGSMTSRRIGDCPRT